MLKRHFLRHQIRTTSMQHRRSVLMPQIFKLRMLDFFLSWILSIVIQIQIFKSREILDYKRGQTFPLLHVTRTEPVVSPLILNKCLKGDIIIIGIGRNLALMNSSAQAEIISFTISRLVKRFHLSKHLIFAPIIFLMDAKDETKPQPSEVLHLVTILRALLEIRIGKA